MSACNWYDDRNLAMLADFYEFTMANGFFEHGLKDQITTFDLFFRRVPENGGFAMIAGLDPLIQTLKHLHFRPEDIAYLRGKSLFSEEFLKELEGLRFTGDIWAMPEGSVAFPGEPILIVRARAIEAQLIETMALLFLNHQSLIATKACRIVRAASGRPVIEFGARRAQGVDAAIAGARAAYIGGVEGTSNTLTDCLYDVPASGTMAHSWIQMFPGEYEAFKAYAETYPENTNLLVDTYNTLKEGVPNAIRVFDEVLKPRGLRPKGIRLDSGDIAYLSKEARKLLDEAGYEDCPIMASNSMDEYKIRELLMQGSKLDAFGVGERLITAKAEPVFGGVYKLVAVDTKEGILPKIKISENVEKITTPGVKTVYRIYDRTTGKAQADLITLFDETIDEEKPLEIFHPIYTWKKKTLRDFHAKKLLLPIFQKGECVYDSPSLPEIRSFAQSELATLWEEVKRLDQAHLYIVDLSYELWSLKTFLLNDRKSRYYQKPQTGTLN